MQTIGTITTIFDTQVISEKFSKREFVLTTEDKYPQEVLFQTVNDNCDKLEPFLGGEKVTVDFNLRGKGYDKKDGTKGYFNSLDAWKITETK